MEMLWPLPIFLLAAMALIAVYAVGPRLVAGSVLARQAFFCPFKQQDVSVDFRQAAWDGRRMDVSLHGVHAGDERGLREGLPRPRSPARGAVASVVMQA